MNFDEEDNEAVMLQAAGMLKKANELVAQHKIKQALNVFMKAIKLYLEIGKYRKISEVMDEILKITHSEIELMPVLDQLLNVIHEVEALDIPEEEGKLKYRLADVYYNSNDYLNAANLYIEASDLLYKADPEYYLEFCGILYLRAGELLEKIGRSEKAEKLVLNGIKRLEISNYDYIEAEKQFQVLIQKKKYEQAIEILREIAQFFRKIDERIDKIDPQSAAALNLQTNLKARIFHMLTEYNLLKMICYRYLGNEDAVKEQATKSIEDLVTSIQLMKEEMIRGFYSSADLHRLSFDVFLLQVFQEYAETQIEDPIDVATRGLSTEIKQILVKMKFYELMVHLLKVGLKDNLDWLEDIDIGAHLSQYKNFMWNSLKNN
jgi:tetratricopeptide (TPR) repeat protein